MYVIFLNGPPGCGKDEAAKALYTNGQGTLRSMIDPVRRAVIDVFDLSVEERKACEAEKDAPQECLHGMSWREALIWFAEDVLKPKFGKAFLGHLLVKDLSATLPNTKHQTAIISGVGFEAECLPVISMVSAERCLLIRITRQGCTYENDSRSYIELEQYGVTCVDLNNKFETPLYHLQVNRVVDQWRLAP